MGSGQNGVAELKVAELKTGKGGAFIWLFLLNMPFYQP